MCFSRILTRVCLCLGLVPLWLSEAQAQDPSFDILMNRLIMDQSYCYGNGGDWTGMSCQGGTSGGGMTTEEWSELAREIEAWHHSQMRKATCLLIVSAKRTPEELGAVMREHVAQYRPEELHIFQENPNSFLLTHGYTMVLIGNSINQRIRRGELPMNASCTKIDYAEKHFRPIAGGKRTGTTGYEWIGQTEFLSRFTGN